jgi:hypothetical protein
MVHNFAGFEKIPLARRYGEHDFRRCGKIGVQTEIGKGTASAVPIKSFQFVIPSSFFCCEESAVSSFATALFRRDELAPLLLFLPLVLERLFLFCE